MFTIKNAGKLFARAGFAILFLSVIIFAQGCHHSRSTRFASHKVTIDRHGITNRFGVEDRDQMSIFHYDGYGANGARMKVTIKNEIVIVNEVNVGMLKVGDAIHIGDEGVRVNSMDYGQSEKYMKANNTGETASTYSD